MYDIIIIGGGPAGLTAALYAGRARLNTLILEQMALGGQMLLTDSIENFPGFPGGISTDKLTQAMEKQARELKVDIESDQATKIIKDSGFKVFGNEGGYQSKSLIIACGASYRKLGIPGEDRLAKRGVSYCATCDGPLFKGKEILAIGGGDKAVEEAILLSKYAKKVTLIHRREQLRASKILQERLFNNKKIEVLWRTVPQEVMGDNKVEALRVKDLIKDQIKEIPAQGIFIFIGIQPNTHFLEGFLNLDKEGFITTDEFTASSQEGVFAAGDCRRKSLNQVITACSDGAVAAFNAGKFLETNK